MVTPTLKLELEGLRQAFMYAIAAQQDEIRKQVDERLKHIIANFDFRTVIDDAANKAIQEVVANSVKSHFSYGEGRKIIEQAVVDALTKKEALNAAD